jgi:dynein light chain roadblock-type
MVEIAQVEEMVKRLSDQKGVLGVTISNGQGVPIRSTMAPEQATHYSTMVAKLSAQSRAFVRELAPEDNLQFLRLRSNEKEVMIAPNFDKEHNLSLTVVQNPNPES